ncbi:MAG: FG-GAP repeat protein, partial [Nitrospirae bacterium]|nr:FG-GAP repeat protein [Nitrospirota bacterium]
SEIDMYASTQFVRSYNFSYTTSGVTGRSLLSSITRYGSDGTSTLPQVTFTYQTNSGGFASPVSGPLIGAYAVAGDFNGDGLADIADSSNAAFTNSTSVYLSQGTSFSQSVNVSTTIPTCIVYNSVIKSNFNSMSVTSAFAGDFNGDGAADLIISVGSSCSFLYNSSYSSGQLSFSQSSTVPYTTISGDFNGDGINDFANMPTGNLNLISVSISQSNGTYNSSVWPLYGQVPQCNYYATGDFNGDGKADILAYGCSDGYARILYSTGNAFSVSALTGDFSSSTVVGDFDGDGRAEIAVLSGQGASAVTRIYSAKDNFVSPATWSTPLPAISGLTITRILVADFNGDGKTDLLISGCSNNGDSGCDSPFTYVYLSTGPIPDLLSTVTSSLGGSTTFTYKPSTSYTNTFLPVVTQAVSSITVNDDNGVVATANYTYAYGLFQNREFRGFGYVKATDPYSNTVETWYLQGDSKQGQDESTKGLVQSQEFKDSNGFIYAATWNSYSTTTPHTGVTFPYLADTYEYLCDGATQTDLTQCKDIQTTFCYDSYGNVTRKYSWGDASISDARYDFTEYNTPDTNNWVLNRPVHTYTNDSTGATSSPACTSTGISDGTGTKKAEAWFGYDSKANLQTKQSWLSTGGGNPVITYYHDAYGNVSKITDALNYTTTIGYDSTTYTYPETNTNALSQTTTTHYDPRYGKPTSKTDPNNNTVTYQYDAFGRSQQVDDPYAGAVASVSQDTYYDGLGRTIKTRKQGPDGKYIVAETNYDKNGRVQSTSVPYFTDSSGTKLETTRWTYYTYDPLGRVTLITNPDQTYRWKSYYQGWTWLVDENSHVKAEQKDAYGRLVTVVEYTGGYPNQTAYATTTYQYDVLGNLVKTTDAGNNQTTISYDSLSRKTSMQDPDMGYWSYSYDANGNLKTQTDAKGRQIQFTYDSLNRITNKHYVNCIASCNDVNYTYDEGFSTNPIGRLTTVSYNSSNDKEQYYYDTMGRVSKDVKTVDTATYTTQTEYDALGRIFSITYPDAETINYFYDSGGNLSSIPGYVNYSDYNALGQPGTIQYANGVATTKNYDSMNNRLASISTTGGLQNLSYGYDNAGNVQMIADGINGTSTQNFLYDELNRLTQAQSSAYGTITYQYNQIGNMTYNSQVGSYSYNSGHPHAATQAGSYSYQYDANGNMTSRTGYTITYDYDNRAVTLSGSSGTVTSVYDYAGQRVKKIAPSGTTIYIGKLYECKSGSCTKYIFAGSTRIASKNSSNTYYYHGDHLNSSSIITDQNGNKVQEINYYPFGQVRSKWTSGAVDVKYKYTGQEEDPETGLYYYNARYYDPILCRFTSPDSIGQNIHDPQSLNRYSYCLNNPLTYTDPSGHFTWKKFFKSVLGGIVGGIIAAICPPAWGAVITGMLAGAAAGATVAALNGGNILQGALLGGMLGGVGGGIYSAFGNTGAYAMLAGGAAYATATGGLNGLAYFAGGVMGGIAGYSGASYVKDNWNNWFSPVKDVNAYQSSQTSQELTVSKDVSYSVKPDGNLLAMNGCGGTRPCYDEGGLGGGYYPKMEPMLDNPINDSVPSVNPSRTDGYFRFIDPELAGQGINEAIKGFVNGVKRYFDNMEQKYLLDNSAS